MKKAIKALEAKIEGYLRGLDAADSAETDRDEPGPSAAELRAKIAELKERQARYEMAQEELKASGAKQVSPDG